MGKEILTASDVDLNLTDETKLVALMAAILMARDGVDPDGENVPGAVKTAIIILDETVWQVEDRVEERMQAELNRRGRKAQ